MPSVTGFSVVVENGTPVPADPHGNNVAFGCLVCSAPVLAVIREHQRGSSPPNPSVCAACGTRFWVEYLEAEAKLVVHGVPL